LVDSRDAPAVNPSGQRRGANWEETMSVQKGDYRTNRADYAIAATHSLATADDSDRAELLARKEKSLWLV